MLTEQVKRVGTFMIHKRVDCKAGQKKYLLFDLGAQKYRAEANNLRTAERMIGTFIKEATR